MKTSYVYVLRRFCNVNKLYYYYHHYDYEEDETEKIEEADGFQKTKDVRYQQQKCFEHYDIVKITTIEEIINSRSTKK
ncbi:hypothetical protein LCGC14_2417360 [marine sediment metagenome]|uniref:Uncharacterized protein n=1 Tax=marine sediment metagenome TaxID=412755 RepID=A0A0F9BQT5_9ZZZZ